MKCTESPTVYGDLSYEEYIPGTEELYLMKKDILLVCESYWEVLCHFYTCIQIPGLRARGVKGQLSIPGFGR